MASGTCSVRVSVRVRPPTTSDSISGRSNAVQVHKQVKAITIGSSQSTSSVSGAGHQFTYDEVYDEHASQTEIYQGVGAGMLSSVFEGYNSTVSTKVRICPVVFGPL